LPSATADGRTHAATERWMCVALRQRRRAWRPQQRRGATAAPHSAEAAAAARAGRTGRGGRPAPARRFRIAAKESAAASAAASEATGARMGNASGAPSSRAAMAQPDARARRRHTARGRNAARDDWVAPPSNGHFFRNGGGMRGRGRSGRRCTPCHARTYART
jgi:hypothetical protein